MLYLIHIYFDKGVVLNIYVGFGKNQNRSLTDFLALKSDFIHFDWIHNYHLIVHCCNLWKITKWTTIANVYNLYKAMCSKLSRQYIISIPCDIPIRYNDPYFREEKTQGKSNNCLHKVTVKGWNWILKLAFLKGRYNHVNDFQCSIYHH